MSSTTKAVLNTPDAFAQATAWQNNFFDTVKYDALKYGTGPGTPSNWNWSLTEPLCKPLHHFSNDELEGLVHELEDSGYGHREASIQRAVEEIVSRRAATGHPDGVKFEFPMTVANGYRTLRIRVVLPTWLPQEYIRPFAERMIRDQLEEEG